MHVAEKYGRDGARNYLDKLSHEERIRLGGQPLASLKNLKAGSSTSQRSPNDIQDEHIEVDANQLDIKAESSTSQKSANDIQDDLMEVIILVALVAKHDVNSSNDLKEVLQLLTSVAPEDGIYPYVVEVLWRPKSSSARRRWL